MILTEDQLDSAVIELLEAESNSTVLGQTIEGHIQEIIVEADCRASLVKRYAAEHIVSHELVALFKSNKMSPGSLKLTRYLPSCTL